MAYSTKGDYAAYNDYRDGQHDGTPICDEEIEYERDLYYSYIAARKERFAKRKRFAKKNIRYGRVWKAHFVAPTIIDENLPF